jgi:hypothetical protein
VGFLRLPIGSSITFLIFAGSPPLYDSTMHVKRQITTKTPSSLPEISRPPLLKPSTVPTPSSTPTTAATHGNHNIEHVPVKDDPRAWSPLRKVSWPFLLVLLDSLFRVLLYQNASLALIASASMVATLSVNIQNREYRSSYPLTCSDDPF